MKSDMGHMLALAAEDMVTVLTFAHSRERLLALRGRFEGDPRSLDKMFGEIPEKRADRALLEMAFLIRAIDDAENISDAMGGTYGKLEMRKGEPKELSLRDFANKAIHARRYEWEIDGDSPAVHCIGEHPEQWVRATVDLNALTTVFGKSAI